MNIAARRCASAGLSQYLDQIVDGEPNGKAKATDPLVLRAQPARRWAFPASQPGRMFDAPLVGQVEMNVRRRTERNDFPLNGRGVGTPGILLLCMRLFRRSATARRQ